MRSLTEEEVEEISALIEDLGLEEFVTDGEAEEAFQGTSLENVLMKYIEAREKLVLALREVGFDV